MDDGSQTFAAAGKASRFELAPPRRFILPGILLMLLERPGYGYGLVPRLQELRFGHVDRPAVYRALARLEADGLVESASQYAKAGQARRVYQVTALGERALRHWMSVIRDEHDYLGEVLRRYQATGTADAILAEVEGGWSTAIGSGWSPVLPTSGGVRRLTSVDREGVPPTAARTRPRTGPRIASAARGHFLLVPERSAVLIEVRSTVGPLSFGALGVTGWVDAEVTADAIEAGSSPRADLRIDISGLRSGNSVYDAELLRRVEASRFPSAEIRLLECVATGPGALYRLLGELTFHGVTRAIEGTVSARVEGERLVVSGEQDFDIRDFSIPSPTVLMLRIYPDVRVRLHVEAEPEEAM